jgi:bile acid:Na+ symporter, BASS family
VARLAPATTDQERAAPFAMSLAQLIKAAILVSVMLIVLSFSLLATWRDATSLFRKPSLLLRSLLAMNVLLPLFAATLVALFSLRPAVAIALIALAASPVPPFLPQKQLKLVVHQEYVFGLLGASSLLSVVLAPLTIALIGLAFSLRTDIAPAAIGRIVALTVLIPFALGLIIRRLIPTFALQASPLVSKAGILLLLVAFVPVLITMWRPMISLIGDGTLVAIVAFVAVGLAAGHLLGEPDPDDRTVLALATATRHPGVALVICAGIFPAEKLVAPALMLYLLVGALASAPYVRWRKHQHRG